MPNNRCVLSRTKSRPCCIGTLILLCASISMTWAETGPDYLSDQPDTADSPAGASDQSRRPSTVNEPTPAATTTAPAYYDEQEDLSLVSTGPEYLSDHPEAMDEPAEASYQIVEDPFFVGDHMWRVHFRSYYLDRQIDNAPTRAAWAAGGWIDWQSPGMLKDTLKLGATAYTSQKIIGDKDKGGTGLLKPVQDSFSGFSSVYADFDFDPTTARVGRFEINLPYMNRSDIRMIPISFQGAQVLHDINPFWTLGLGYYTDIKQRDSDNFQSLYKVAGVTTADGATPDDGVIAVGLRFDQDNTAQEGGLFYQHAPDFMDTYYAEYGQPIVYFNGTSFGDTYLGKNSSLSLTGQYTRQQSVGMQLDGDFSIDQYGAKLTWQNDFISATLAYTYYSKSNNQRIRHPWGSVAGYTSVQYSDFDRPGEKASLAGLGIDLTEFGLPGLVFSTSYTYGNTPDSGSAASPDQSEFDVELNYTVQETFLEGLQIRVRNAMFKQSSKAARPSDTGDLNDFRVILNYVWVY